VQAVSKVQSLPKIQKNISTLTVQDCKNTLWNNRELKVELLQYMLPSPFINWDAEIQEFALGCLHSNIVLYEGVMQLCHKIFKEFKFVSNATSIYTPIKTVLKERRGVCQDFSHLAIACLRSMGLALDMLADTSKRFHQLDNRSYKARMLLTLGFRCISLRWAGVNLTRLTTWFLKSAILLRLMVDYSDVAPLKGVIFSSGGTNYRFR
jgi:hypothetical protein